MMKPVTLHMNLCIEDLYIYVSSNNSSPALISIISDYSVSGLNFI